MASQTKIRIQLPMSPSPINQQRGGYPFEDYDLEEDGFNISLKHSQQAKKNEIRLRFGLSPSVNHDLAQQYERYRLGVETVEAFNAQIAKAQNRDKYIHTVKTYPLPPDMMQVKGHSPPKLSSKPADTRSNPLK